MIKGVGEGAGEGFVEMVVKRGKGGETTGESEVGERGEGSRDRG